MNKRTKKRSKSVKLRLFLFILIVAAAAAGIYKMTDGNFSFFSSQDTTMTPEEAEKTVKRYASLHGIDFDEYPQSLIDLLARNTETKDFVLSYPSEHDKTHEIDMSEYKDCTQVPLFMQWDKRWGYIMYGDDIAGLTACGPVCLSMAAYYITKDDDMSPDKIIEFAIENGYCVDGEGSSWSLISEGGEKLGLDVTEIPLDEDRLAENLKVGNPVICIMGPGDFTKSGHFIVMTGYEDGKISVNDPNSRKNSDKEWYFDDIKDQILNLWVIR